MAGQNWLLNFEDVALVANTWVACAAGKAPSDQMVRLKRPRIFCDGTSGSDKPIAVRIARITAASGTGTNTNPVKANNSISCAIRSTGRVNFTVLPTLGDILYVGKFHPQSGILEDLFFDNTWVAEATEVALLLKVPSGGPSTLLATGSLVAEE